VYAARAEYCQTAVDFLARRTRLAFLDIKAAEEALPRVVELLGAELKWSFMRRRREISDAKKFLSTFKAE
jgi:glycerol-3-phosphate dehydrogenase